MKICFLGDASMNHVARWVNYFVGKGHDCFVISLEEGQKFECPFHHVHMPGLPQFIKYPLSTLMISSLIRSFDPDIVNAMFIPNYGFVAALLNARPLAVTTMGSDVLVVPKKSFFHRWRTRYVLSRSDLVTSDAWMMTEKIVSFGFEAGKVLTVPMGVDKTVFNAEGRAPYSAKKPVIVSTRQLGPIYNVAMLMDAIPEILRAVPGAKFVIAGTGPEQTKLEEAARRYAISESVSFPGWLDPQQLASLLKTATIYVSTSLSDSTSVSLLEAMACGAFPVVSNIAGNREWIENNSNGLLFGLGGAGTLAKTIIAALSNEELISKAAEKNHEIIEKKAVWTDNMSVVEGAFAMLKK